MQRTFALLLSALALLVAGCATTRVVDSDVTAFSAWPAAPAAPGTTYRFERLPSQQLPGSAQDRIEAIAQTSLARVGMVLSPAHAKLSVQVVANTQRLDRLTNNGFILGGPSVLIAPGGYIVCPSDVEKRCYPLFVTFSSPSKSTIFFSACKSWNRSL